MECGVAMYLNSALRRRMASVDTIAADYDRTLTTMDLQLTQKTIDLVDRLCSEGMRFIVVSGRSFHFMNNLVARFGGVDSFVAENGAIIYSGGDTVKISEEEGEKIKELLTSYGVHFVPGIVISYVAKGHIEEAERAVQRMGGISKLVRNIDSGMVLPRDVDKDVGLRVALSLKGGSFSRTLVVGDGENDISLYRTDAVRIALANSVAQLKERADAITEHAGSEGFAEIAESILEARGLESERHFISKD